MAAFQLVGIAPAPFVPLFELSDEQLRQRGATRVLANASPGFPCRVSLEDAQVGEELLLVSYLHQPAASPYRASGPIFVRRNAKQCTLLAGEVPPYVMRRLISVRAYDAHAMLVDAAVCAGTCVAERIHAFFRRPSVSYIHLHNAERGCFSCHVNRA